MAKTYNFRLRFTCSPIDVLNGDDRELFLPKADPTHNISLIAREKDTSIKKAEAIVLHGSGWSEPKEAEKFGNFYGDALARTLARFRIGVDFGERAPKSAFTKYGLELVAERTGKPTINDIHGLMVYEEIENIQFIQLHGKGVRGVPTDKFLNTFAHIVNQPKSLTNRERVALELFNQSFFQHSADSRFLLLMNGIEALIEQGDRSSAVDEFLKTLISITNKAENLEQKEKDSLKSGLGLLRRESIVQAGKRFVKDKLIGRQYFEKSSEEFFVECYEIRSRLVHGGIPFPKTEEVRSVVGQLEVMVSDLLSSDLLNVEP